MPITPEQRAAKQKLANTKAKIRLLLTDGKIKDAEECASKAGISVFDARLGPEYKHPTEAAFVALEALYKAETEGEKRQAEEAEAKKIEVLSLDDDEVAPETASGWPIKTEAKIWGFPPNKNMVVIQLPDGRKASMWKGRANTWRIHDKVECKIEKSDGDPIYEALPRIRY